MLVIVCILVVIVVVLLIYDMIIHKKVESFKKLNEKITGYNVLQDFMNTIGESTPVDYKIHKINDILIENFDIKYSTIVVFDGAEYVIRATNVDERHWDTLRNLQKEEIFKDSISTANPKYVTINNDTEKLPYQRMEFARAKSAMFFPLYIDNIYIGYWIIESGEKHAFDNVDTTILEVAKDNITSILKTVAHQRTIESLVRKDLFTGLYSAEYLYGEGKKIIDKYDTSTVCMFTITNIDEINKKYNRETGNQMITEVAEYIAKNISKEYVFVRYMGPKFVIVFSGIETSGVANFIADMKNKIEELKIEFVDEYFDDEDYEDEDEDIIYARPILNFVITTYYKGTAIESINKKLEEYLNNADKDESDINYI